MPRWTPEDLQRHIEQKIEESQVLEYKQAKALEKSDIKKAEIAKTVSAMANSEGGVIIYGIEEERHLPIRVTWINRHDFSREWLDQVISTGITPRIPDLLICTIDLDATFGAYVIQVPKSSTVHQCVKDFKYYQRSNFEAKPMVDAEIRLVMSRGVRFLIATKLSRAFGMLYAFFTMVAHRFFEDDDALYSRIMSVLDPGLTRDPGVVDEVVELLLNTIRNERVFDPAGGTLRGLPKGKGLIRIMVERSVAPDESSLPASFILNSGIESVISAVGSALATYGPAMGIDLIQELDKLYESLHSARSVIGAHCANNEYLESVDGRISDPIFLAHIRILLMALAKFHTQAPDAAGIRPS